MKTSREKIYSLLDSGYTFQLGDYLSKGWELYKRGFWSFAGFTLLFIALQVTLSIVPVIGTLVSLFISAPLSAGYLLMAHQIGKKEHQEFSTFFKGFDYFGQLVLLSILQSVVLFGLLSPLLITSFSGIGNLADFGTSLGEEMLNPDFSFSPAPWTYFLLIPLIYLSIAWRWAVQLVIFQGFGPFEALEVSRRIITKQWFMFLLFYVIAGLIVVSGVFLLFVGVLFTLSFIYCADYAAFAKVTHLQEDQEADITEHLVE